MTISPVLSDRYDDLGTPGVVVTLDAAEAERLGAFEEAALSEADAWDAIDDLVIEASEAAPDHAWRIASAVIEQLKAGTAPWTRDGAPGEGAMPYNPVSGTDYRGANAIWLMSRADSAGFGDTRWMTRRQALEAGGTVRPGEAGTPIQFWASRGLEHVRDPSAPDTEPYPRRLARYESPRVWLGAVFNGDQINGLRPAPVRPQPSEVGHHHGVENIRVDPGAKIRPIPGGPAQDPEDVTVPPAEERDRMDDRSVASAPRALGHRTGHAPPLSDDAWHPPGSDGWARAALRADISSLFLGARLRVDYRPEREPDIAAHWIRLIRDDPGELLRAAADAEKMVAFLGRRARERARDNEPARELDPAPVPDTLAAMPAPEELQMPTLIPEDHPAMAAMEDRTYLAVPYDEKDDAKTRGAAWDRQAKAWFVPAGVDLDAFRPWLPAMGQVHIAVAGDPRVEFARALRESGLRIDGLPLMDGTMRRVPVEGDRGGQRGGAYVGHLDGRPAGFIQNFRTGTRVQWKATGQAAPLDALDRARLAAEAAQRRHDRAAEREKQYERVAQEVDAIWTAATPVEAHPYLAEKGVRAHGLRVGADGRLLVPARDADGKPWSLQHIAANGTKQFHPDARLEGGHFVIGDIGQPGPLLIAEGYATAASVHELTGQPTLVAFTAGNLGAVARTYRGLFPDRPIYIAADNDHHREAQGKPNVGLEKANQAAAAIGGFALPPVFAGNDNGSDWNDLVRSEGADHARGQLRVGFAIAERGRIARSLSETGQRGDTAMPSRSATHERIMEMER